MKKELFDGHLLKIKLIGDELFEASLMEAPHFNVTASNYILLMDEFIEKFENGENIPIPASKKNFSGQINIRIEPSIHQALAIEANKSGMSLNSLISKKLAPAMDVPINLSDLKISELKLGDRYFMIGFIFNGNKSFILNFSPYYFSKILHFDIKHEPLKLDSFLKSNEFIDAVKCFIQPIQNRLCDDRVLNCLLYRRLKDKNSFYIFEWQSF